jgi:parallel beta-helix repeat protein
VVRNQCEGFDHTISNNIVTNAFAGIILEEVFGSEISNNQITNSLLGIYVEESGYFYKEIKGEIFEGAKREA